MKTEPARIIGYLTTLVTAIAGILISIGIPVSEQTQNALITAIGIWVPIIIFIVEFIRTKVWPEESVAKEVELATAHPVPVVPKQPIPTPSSTKPPPPPPPPPPPKPPNAASRQGQPPRTLP